MSTEIQEKGIDLLASKVRPLTQEDKKNRLFTVSFSKLDLFDNCSFKYDLQYNKKNYVNSEAIHLDLGNIAHKVLELKGRMLKEGKEIDLLYLRTVLFDGIEEKTDKGNELIIGVTEIKKKYGFELWYAPDNASGMNYEEKINIFLYRVLPKELTDEDWEVFGCEEQFDFVYTYGYEDEAETIPKEVIIHGFIDSLSVKRNEEGEIIDFKVTDFKTSKKTFPDVKTKTSLQQLIYGLSVYTNTGILPSEYEFSFILINEKQQANSRGYLTRGLSKLDKILNSIADKKESGTYQPSPTPLCHWCQFSKTNPDAVEPYNSLCPYYSLWTPTQKTFAVNQPYLIGENGLIEEKEDFTKPKIETKRKLIF